MLMAMEPIWESDFHPASYGFRPARSVHHAIRTVKLQLQDSGEQSVAGRWVVEGDLASYFDTVHHRLLMKGIRKRIADQRFLDLLWKFIKAGCVDRGLFRAASEGVPQGGVISPLLSNIMLHEFDMWMEQNYLSKKVRKDRWSWNFGILKQRPIAVRENWQWKPAIAYCRYADDFLIVVKGTRKHPEAVREACRSIDKSSELSLSSESSEVLMPSRLATSEMVSVMPLTSACFISVTTLSHASILTGQHDDPVLAIPTGIELDATQWEIGVFNGLPGVLIAVAIFIDHDRATVFNQQSNQDKPVLCAEFIQVADHGVHEPVSACGFS